MKHSVISRTDYHCQKFSNVTFILEQKFVAVLKLAFRDILSFEVDYQPKEGFKQ